MTSSLSHEALSWEGDFPSQHLKVALIREELIALTGDLFSAVILSQLLYWTKRVKDFDLLLEEERSFHPECNLSPRHGWIYKTAHNLNEETMLNVSHPTMRKYLKHLIQRGWIDQRSNPKDKWNKTTQYRVNLRTLQEDLKAIGYTLPDIHLGYVSHSEREESVQKESSQESLPMSRLLQGGTHSADFNSDENNSDSSKIKETPNVKNLHSNEKILRSNVKNFSSNVKNLHSYTYTENTPKTKNKEHTHLARETALSMIENWKEHIGQDKIHLTKKRTERLGSILSSYFQNDLSQWDEFCKYIKESPFLMGEGPKKWHISFDWILKKGNVLKVIEGNFEDPEVTKRKKNEKAEIIREQKTREILESIQDLSWRDWCSQLSEFPDFGYYQVHRFLSWWELERISKAKFVDFDGRLATIGSSDSMVLNEIEKHRFQIATIITRTYSQCRSIRTELLTESEFSQEPSLPSHPESPTNNPASTHTSLISHPRKEKDHAE